MSNPNIASRFDKIYDSTNKAVLAFITVKCKNTADISDIFQDTYMELYQRLNKHGADYVIDGKAFVFRIAKHKIYRYYSVLKRLRSFVSIDTTAKNESEEDFDLSETEADSFLTEDFVVDQIMLDNIKMLIKQKPKDVEQIFYFFYDMEMSIPEIAQTMFLSESNVKNKIYRTLKEIRDLLK